MSIIIKNMDMPASCLRCPFIKQTRERHYVGRTVTDWHCCITKQDIEIQGELTGRREDCPLFELKDWRNL